MKVFKRIVNIVLGAVFIVTLGVFLMSTITSRSNYGIPNFFGYQYMVVKSDSMAPTLKVNTGIVVHKDDVTTLIPQQKDSDGNIVVEGDIISYYSPSIGAVITHRLIDVTKTSGKYILTAIGENTDSNQCPTSGVCTYTPETFTESHYLGRVISVSEVMGGFFSFMTNKIAIGCLIGLPAAYLFFSIIYDFLKEHFLKEKDDEDEDDKNPGEKEAK